jgi:hypothetical protein
MAAEQKQREKCPFFQGIRGYLSHLRFLAIDC